MLSSWERHFTLTGVGGGGKYNDELHDGALQWCSIPSMGE